MSSEQIYFTVEESELSGILERPRDEAKSVVMVLHPHPLYGGDMYNPVVDILSSSFLEVGFATFRFDFRGVTTRSDYAGILGAVDDATAAWKMIETRGLKMSGIAGYSFGGSTALRCSSINKVDFLVSISSSFDLYQEGGYEVSHLSKIECPVLLFHGTSDLTVPYENMARISSQLRGEVKCISLENEGHFYHHSLTRVQDELKHFMQTMRIQQNF